MIKNAESLAAVHTHTHTRYNSSKKLEAFFAPRITIETSKVTHTK